MNQDFVANRLNDGMRRGIYSWNKAREIKLKGKKCRACRWKTSYKMYNHQSGNFKISWLIAVIKTKLVDEWLESAISLNKYIHGVVSVLCHEERPSSVISRTEMTICIKNGEVWRKQTL
jgi:hypothetical protein